MGSAGVLITLQSPDQPLTAANSPAGNISISTLAGAGSMAGEYQIRTNTNSQISMIASAAIASGISAVSRGWIDYRGK
jgi:hypothetical protein